MPAEQATAIVIRRVDFSESSLVVTLFTREAGKITALAKGAKRLKSPFESALDLLALSQIVFLRKPSASLDLLTEAKLLRRFRLSGRDLRPWYAGFYVAELLIRFTHEYEPCAELFDLADATLMQLCRGENIAVSILAFEVGLLRSLGHMPVLDRCVDCGCKLEEKQRVHFGHITGGTLCHKCAAGKRQVATISQEAVQFLKQLAAVEPAQLPNLQPDRNTLGHLRGLLNTYIAVLLGNRPTTQQHLKAIFASAATS